MANDEEFIRKSVLDGKETEYVDFKEKFYLSLKDSDFVKDIAAFANCEVAGDKYIVFGVTDKEHTVVGIDPSKIPDPSSLENIISEKIEPRIKIQCGSLEIDEKSLYFVKVPRENNNPPYVIRSDNSKEKQGDIIIRVGTCNRKANRADIDAMYKRNLHASIKLYSDSVLIAPIKMPKELIKEPTYGMVDVELVNPTAQPILIYGGYITIKNRNCSIDRRICRIDARYYVADNPYSLASNFREKRRLLFEFLSQDCISLGFEETGFLNVDTEIQVTLFDTDQHEYKTETISAFLTAKGDILWKMKECNKQTLEWKKTEIGIIKQIKDAFSDEDKFDLIEAKIIPKYGWKCVQEALFTILLDDSSTPDEYENVANVFWVAVLDKMKIEKEKAIALLYYRLGDVNAPYENNTIWSIVSALYNLDYANSEYNALKDEAIIRELEALGIHIGSRTEQK